MDRETQLIELLSERIAKAKIDFEKSNTTRKRKHKHHIYAALLIAFIGLYGMAASDKTDLGDEIDHLKKALHTERTVIRNIGLVKVSDSQQNANEHIIATCSRGLIQAIDYYVLCAQMPI